MITVKKDGGDLLFDSQAQYELWKASIVVSPLPKRYRPLDVVKAIGLPKVLGALAENASLNPFYTTLMAYSDGVDVLSADFLAMSVHFVGYGGITQLDLDNLPTVLENGFEAING